MKIKKLILLLSLILIVVSINTVAYATGPLCEIYWMTDKDGGGDGTGPGGTGTIQYELDDIFYNANRYQDTSAYYVRRTMDDDAIFVISSHGDAGRVDCNNGTYVSAEMVLNDNDCYSLEAYHNSHSWWNFDKMKFVFWSSCFSARTHVSYGNLAEYSVNTLGAESSMGFNLDVMHAECSYFEEELFENLCNNDTLYNAKKDALIAVYDLFDSYGDTESAIIYGDEYVKIYPAAYSD